MSIELWLAFTAASVVVLAVPGPTILLVTSFALHYGTAAALRTVGAVVAGDALAMALSLAGVGALLMASATLFTLLKWAGAAYLVWLGIGLWRTPSPAPSATVGRAPRALSRQAFVVTALNPKSIAFFVAFMPQFVTPAAPVPPQLVLLGATFLMLAAVNAALYAALAGRLGAALTGPVGWRWARRLGGGALIGAGVLTAGLRRGA